MAREAKTKQTTYLRINAEGQLYSGSSEPREGHVEYTSKQGNVSYRKTYAGTDYGKITQLHVVEKDFPTGKVKYLEVTVENEESRDVVQLPLKNIKGGLTDEVKKFIAILPGIDFSRELTISSNRKKNERGYVEKVLFVNYVTDGVQEKDGVKFSLKFGKEGTVPMFEQREGLEGEIIYDFTKQDKFMFEELVKQLERFKAEKGAEVKAPEVTAKTPEAEEAPKKKASTTKGGPKIETPAQDESDDDDLPF